VEVGRVWRHRENSTGNGENRKERSPWRLRGCGRTGAANEPGGRNLKKAFASPSWTLFRGLAACPQPETEEPQSDQRGPNPGVHRSPKRRLVDDLEGHPPALTLDDKPVSLPDPWRHGQRPAGLHAEFLNEPSLDTDHAVSGLEARLVRPSAGYDSGHTVFGIVQATCTTNRGNRRKPRRFLRAEARSSRLKPAPRVWLRQSRAVLLSANPVAGGEEFTGFAFCLLPFALRRSRAVPGHRRRG
jgi:hypothetical protein